MGYLISLNYCFEVLAHLNLSHPRQVTREMPDEKIVVENTENEGRVISTASEVSYFLNEIYGRDHVYSIWTLRVSQFFFFFLEGGGGGREREENKRCHDCLAEPSAHLAGSWWALYVTCFYVRE